MVECKMKTLALWETTPPTAAQLASTAPFACDELSLTQWVQWVLLPKLSQWLQQPDPSPLMMDLAPYAQLVWKADPNALQLLPELLALQDQIQGGSS